MSVVVQWFMSPLNATVRAADVRAGEVVLPPRARLVYDHRPEASTMPSRMTMISKRSLLRDSPPTSQKGLLSLITCVMVCGSTSRRRSPPVSYLHTNSTGYSTGEFTHTHTHSHNTTEQRCCLQLLHVCVYVRVCVRALACVRMCA